MPGCRYTNLDRQFSIEDLAAFHGHLGPYVVLGYRIGRYAREHFSGDPFRLKAVVSCPGFPPHSCLLDGIQARSCCTRGKRNLEHRVSDSIVCEFTVDQKKIVVRPKQFMFPPTGDDCERLTEQLAVDMYGMEDTKLFEISLKYAKMSDNLATPYLKSRYTPDLGTFEYMGHNNGFHR